MYIYIYMQVGVSEHGLNTNNGSLNRRNHDKPMDLGIPYFQTKPYGGFLSHGSTPSYHPC